MTKFYRTTLSIIALLGAFFGKAQAAEYPWFKVHGFEGWIEYAPASTTDRRINVLPRLYGPSFTGEFGGANVNTSNLLVVKPDGEILLKFLVMGNTAKLPATFKDDVYNSLQAGGFIRNGFTLNSIRQYQLMIPKINNLKAVLIVNGEVKQSVQIPPNTYVDGEYTGEFRISPDDDIYGNIQNADFKIQLEYEFPYQTFSGATLNLSQTALTNIKVDVFKQVIRQVRTSGTKILWMDFRSTYVRTIEKERINTSASSKYDTKLEVVLRDPDETTLKFLDDIMGKQELSKEKLIAQHEKLITQANQHNNPTLGKLSKEYIDAVRADDHTAQINILDALSSLAKDDILGFLSSGISFAESSASGSYTYIASIQSTYTTTANDFYSQHVIKTSRYTYQTALDNFPMLANVLQGAREQQMNALFGTANPTPFIVDNTLVKMVTGNNLQNARYCLLLGASPNQVTGPDMEPLLNYALKKRYYSLAKLLVKNGANPNLKNRHGEDGQYLLENVEDKALAEAIRAAIPLSGKVGLAFSLRPLGPEFKMDMANINFRVQAMQTSLKPSANDTWTTDPVTLFPGDYNIEISLFTYFLLPKNSPELNDPYQVQRYTNAGYLLSDNGAKVRFSKVITIYDRIKVLKNGSNTYQYSLYTDPSSLAVTEANNRHINNYDAGNTYTGAGGANGPTYRMQDVMFNFEKPNP